MAFSALVRQHEGLPLYPKSGPPLKVTPDDLRAVLDETRARAEAGNAVYLADVPGLIETRRRSRLINQHQEIPPVSRSTLFGNRQKLDLAEIHADTQTQARAAAKADLRNGISLCAVATACLENVLPHLTFCFDEVAFFLEHNKKPVVVAPRDIVADLRAHHQSVKVTEPRPQRRTISLLNFVCRDGVRVHTALRLKDAAIQALKEHVISPSLSVWLYPTSTNEAVFVDKYFRDRIIPLICEKRCGIAVAQLAGLSASLPDNVSQYAAQHKDAVDAKCASLRTVMCMDGDLPQTQAFMELGLGDYCAQYVIEYLKLSASCSGHESALDLAKSHQLMREALQKSHYDQQSDLLCSVAMSLFIQDVLSKLGIPSKSLQTFRKFFGHIESLMDKTFNALDLQHGWRLSGICPLSFSTVLSHCPMWGTLPTSKADDVLAAILPLAEIVRLKGELTDSEIQAAVGGSVDLGPDKVNPMGPVNRRRCVWGNNAGFLASYAKKKEAEEQAKQATQQKRDIRAAAKKRKASSASHKENKPPPKTRAKPTVSAPTVCSNPVCLVPFNEKLSSASKWLRCEFCCHSFCTKSACKAIFSKHKSICQFSHQ